MATRQTTPSHALTVLNPANSLKRALSEDLDSDSLPDSKKTKLTASENTPQSKDKKKRRRRKKKLPVVATGGTLALSAMTPASTGKGKRKAMSAPPASPEQVLQVEPETRQTDADSSVSQIVEPESSLATIARLKEELSAQSALLKKHESTLANFSNALICQICLDLLHKPYALTPCGHVACYNCLVSWFTREPEENHFGLLRKKTCPNCRATIKQRPVEVWSIKEMVVAFLKSGLASSDLSTEPPPAPALPGPPQHEDANPRDPWYNIFRYPHQHPMFHPPGTHGDDIQDMGMLDAEDGGVYRCLDCNHEIWDGVCTSCQRVYPGHQTEEENMFDFDEDDSDEGDGPMFLPHFSHIHHAADFDFDMFAHPLWVGGSDEDEDEELGFHHHEEDGTDSFIDDGDEEEEHQAAAIIEIDSDSESESQPRRSLAPPRRRAPISLISSDDEDSDQDNRPRSRVRRANPVSVPEANPVIVVSDDDTDDDVVPPPPRRSRLQDESSEDQDDNEEEDEDEGRGHGPEYGDFSDEDSNADGGHVRFEDFDGSGSDNQGGYGHGQGGSDSEEGW
ncbi:hypothetical protein FB45DRAFT_918197 [Roridomyces roridus]|uniref:RING-type domain-containing protein n=1 Tax=Roridomyces roridus TaxID=1738132 RepID=A0AAD7FMY9_9AGAR|nr:hypothetical protein FB45DRAFT_918197 [Roridomyces roridus]